MSRPQIVILGAGPAGLAAARQIARRNFAQVTVLEKNGFIGGTAASFDFAGLRVDYGSHRLHVTCDRKILDDLQSLLGEDLLHRPRHGRIRLRGRWIHFPLKPLDLALRLPVSFTAGVLRDAAGKILRKNLNQKGPDTFAAVLQAGLGRTISQDFYFPYAAKMWGFPPEELSGTQARRRVSAGSFKRMLGKILSAVPGIGSDGKGRFFYPRRGFGEIGECLSQAAQDAGASVHLNTEIKSIETDGKKVNRVSCEENGTAVSYCPDYTWSTVPLPELIRFLEPQPPSSVVQASRKMEYRSLILVYLALEQDRFSEYDAHYFPEPHIPMTRLSEPKNYTDAREPRGRTTVCAELPCSIKDPYWRMSDEEIGGKILHALEIAEIPVRAPVRAIATKRVQYAYPIYRRGYEANFGEVDQWLEGVENLLTFGRQGLFAHDNIHHALSMGYCAAACLDEKARFDRERWRKCRRAFASHVVED